MQSCHKYDAAQYVKLTELQYSLLCILHGLGKALMESCHSSRPVYLTCFCQSIHFGNLMLQYSHCVSFAVWSWHWLCQLYSILPMHSLFPNAVLPGHSLGQYYVFSTIAFTLHLIQYVTDSGNLTHSIHTESPEQTCYGIHSGNFMASCHSIFVVYSAWEFT